MLNLWLHKFTEKYEHLLDIYVGNPLPSWDFYRKTEFQKMGMTWQWYDLEVKIVTITKVIIDMKQYMKT